MYICINISCCDNFHSLSFFRPPLFIQNFKFFFSSTRINFSFPFTLLLLLLFFLLHSFRLYPALVMMAQDDAHDDQHDPWETDSYLFPVNCYIFFRNQLEDEGNYYHENSLNIDEWTVKKNFIYTWIVKWENEICFIFFLRHLISF